MLCFRTGTRFTLSEQLLTNEEPNWCMPWQHHGQGFKHLLDLPVVLAQELATLAERSHLGHFRGP